MNDLRIRDVAEGLIPPYPTLVPVDVARYHNARAAAGMALVQGLHNTGPLPSLPVLPQMDPRATIDVGREFYLAGYTTALPVADVDAVLGIEAARASASAYPR